MCILYPVHLNLKSFLFLNEIKNKDLNDVKLLNENSYEWLRVLKYRCDKGSTFKKGPSLEHQDKSTKYVYTPSFFRQKINHNCNFF